MRRYLHDFIPCQMAPTTADTITHTEGPMIQAATMPAWNEPGAWYRHPATCRGCDQAAADARAARAAAGIPDAPRQRRSRRRAAV